MVPDTVSTYHRYKEDTATFTTWLGQMAKKSGWKPTIQPTESVSAQPRSSSKDDTKGPRLKGKARKAAKEAAKSTGGVSSKLAPGLAAAQPTEVSKYTIPTQELIRQASSVVNSDKGNRGMPEKIRSALEKAIEARRRCAAWYERKQLRSKSSRDGHQHFIDVLQKALDMLDGSSTKTKLDVPTNASHAKAQTTDMDFMRNAFKALEEEDVSDGYESELTPNQEVPEQPAQTTRQTTRVYEVEVDETWEFAFATYSFFEDLHRLRAEIRSIWSRYTKGTMSLLQATILTAACLDMVRRAEDETYQMFTDVYHNPSKHTYCDLASILYKAESIQTGKQRDFMSVETLELSEFDEFAFYPVGPTLLKLGGLHEVMLKSAWPVPIPAMRFNYIVRPELMDEPRMLRYEEQDEFISQVFLDMNLYDTLQGQSKQAPKHTCHISPLQEMNLPFDDPLFTSFRPLWTTGAVTVKSVFAAQILYDIHDICCKSTTANGTEILQKAAGHYKNVFKFIVSPDGTLDTEDVRWLPKDSSLVMTIYGRIEQHMMKSVITDFKDFYLNNVPDSSLGGALGLEELPPPVRERIEAKMRAQGWTPPAEEHERNAERLGANKVIKPHQDPAFVVNENLLFAGTLLLDVASMSEEAGVTLANHHLSIFATAHLYNALVQLGICDIHWPEMQQIIDLHAGPIFAHDIPTNAADMVSRYAYRTGLKTRNSKRFNTKMPWKFQATPATQTFRAFFSGKESLSQLLGTLAIQAQSHSGQASSAPRNQGPARTVAQPQQQQHNMPKMTPRHTMRLLESYIATVLPDIELDYINLTRRCNAFMRRLRARIATELGIKYPSMTLPGDSNDHGFLVMVLGILDEARETEARRSSRTPRDQTSLSSDGDKGDVTSQMRIAKEILVKDLGRTT